MKKRQHSYRPGKARLPYMFIFFWGTAALILILAFFRGREIKPEVAVNYRMSTVIEQRWYGSGAKEMIKDVDSLIDEMEQKLSFYGPGSEIDRINENAGIKPVVVSRDVFELISRTKEFCQTRQARDAGFDCMVGPLVVEWDITGENPHVPESEKVEELLSLVDWRDILLDERACTVMLRRMGQKLDLGAVAKGYICGRIGELSQQHRLDGGFVSVGGNVVAIGTKPKEQKFIFSVQDPRGREGEGFGSVELPLDLNGKTLSILATSGDYFRYFKENGVRYHHILDAHTGYPKESDLISVTILSADGFMSDALSTLLFMEGTEGLAAYKGTSDFAFIAVDKKGAVYLSDNLQTRFTMNPNAGMYHPARWE